MPAGVRRQPVPPVIVDRVPDPAALQQVVELLAIIPQIQLLAMAAEDIAIAGSGDQGVDIGLDLRRDRHGAPLPRLRFDAADKTAPLGRIIGHGELQQRGGTESQITVAENGSGHAVACRGRFPDQLQLLLRKARLFLPGGAGEAQEGREVPVLRDGVPRDPVFVHKTEGSLRVLLGAAPGVGLVQAVLQSVDVEILHFDVPELREKPEAGPVAVHRAAAAVVRGLPLVIQLLQGDPCPLPLRGRAGARPAIRSGQRDDGSLRVLPGAVPAFDDLAALVRHRAGRRVLRQRIHDPADRLRAAPLPVRELIHRAEAVAPAFCLLFWLLLPPAAPGTEDSALRDLPGAFRINAVHRRAAASPGPPSRWTCGAAM